MCVAKLTQITKYYDATPNLQAIYVSLGMKLSVHSNVRFFDGIIADDDDKACHEFVYT